MQVDRLWTNGRLMTMAEGSPGLGVVERGAIACRDGQIVFAGSQSDLPTDIEAQESADLEGRWVSPGLIDCHTHLVYGGNRAKEVDLTDIQAVKAAGNASDDWDLTRRLCFLKGVEVSLAAVKKRFERLYQGPDGSGGLKRNESLTVSRDRIASWAARYTLGVVTGRPRSDADEFLTRFGVGVFFDVVVTRDDAPMKPDPAPVEKALADLGIETAWMVGDTPDDLAAARLAGVVPIGVIAPGAASGPARLSLSSAARVIDTTEELEEMLP